MKSNKIVSIDGKSYTVVPYTTTGGLRLLTKLTGILGEPVVKLLKSLPPGSLQDILKSDLKAINMDEISASVAALFAKVDEDVAEVLIKEILQNTLYGNHEVNAIFEEHFQGEYRHLFKVVFKTLEAQYGDFLGARAVRAKASAATAAQKTV